VVGIVVLCSRRVVKVEGLVVGKRWRAGRWCWQLRRKASGERLRIIQRGC
jgi:hypothetical protein